MSTEPGLIPRPPEAQSDHGEGDHEKDFFPLFNFSSGPFYHRDVNVGASLRKIGQPIQGAASAVVGGILSAVDTALAILNEEFDNPSESMISTATYCEKAGAQLALESETANESKRSGGQSEGFCAAGKNSIISYYRQTPISKLIKNHSIHSPEEMGSSRTKAAFTSHDTITDATLQDEVASDLEPDLENYGGGNINLDLLCPVMAHEKTSELNRNFSSSTEDRKESEQRNDEFKCLGYESEEKYQLDDTAYSIIGHESETYDGWLVVSDD